MKHLILTTLVVLATAAVANANYLSNGDFEADAIINTVGTGQTQVVPGSKWDNKPMNINPASGGYAGDIEAVQDWTAYYQWDNNRFSDSGLSRYTGLGGSETQQFAFINNWNRRFSQTVTETVEYGKTYTAEIDFGHDGNETTEDKGGDLTLYAGPMDATNPDNPAAGTIELAKISAGNTLYETINSYDLDVIIEERDVWIHLSVSYEVTDPADPAIGKPLTLSFRTLGGSGGATYWDNAVLTPEPASLVLLALAGALIRRR